MKKTRWFILGLTLVVCAAVFVNWKYVQELEDNVLSNENQEGKILGDIAFVSSMDDTYFDTARYTRQKSRDEAIAVLNTIVENEKADAESRIKASENINTYAQITEKEAIIENLIKSKGFSECIVFLSADNASVVVETKALQATEAAQIKDIVITETGLPSGVVKIIEYGPAEG